MSSETIERSFQVESPAHLKVSNIRGSVDIRASEEGVISVSAVKHTNSGSNDQTRVVIEQRPDGVVAVESRYEASIANWLGLNKPCKVDYVIRVPRACSAKVSCVSSEASLAGLEGDFDLDSVSGDLHLKDLSGNFDLKSVSGKIVGENSSGALDFDSVSGSVRISGANFPSISGNTVSGNVELHTALAEGPYKLNTVSGNVTLVVPEDSACTVASHSISGRVYVSLPAARQHGNGRNGVMDVRAGGVKVAFNSISGYLRIRTDQESEVEAEATSSGATETPSKAKSRMRILQEIEEGKLSVAEALQQMNP